MIPPLPLTGEAAQKAVQDELLRRGVGDGEGFAAGLLQEFAVAQRVGDVESKRTGLAGGGENPPGREVEKGFGGFQNHWGGRPRWQGGGEPPRRDRPRGPAKQ